MESVRFSDCRVVQLVAHHTLDVGVLGSSPSAAATAAKPMSFRQRVKFGFARND